MSRQADENDTENGAYGDELKQGTELLRGQYRIARFLNAGGFGITYLARDSLDRVVVIKECFPSSMCCRQDGLVKVRSKSYEADFAKIVKLFGQEARALAKAEHPNIVGVHQVFEDNNTAYMALDFVRGRDLLDILDEESHRLTPDVMHHVVVRCLEAVEYIHERGILHRDISPDNILLDQSNEPVLIDFGAAREEASRVTRKLSEQHTVKDGYSPQEFYVSGSAQTLSSDLYSLGATFYHLITGDPPPVSQTRLAAVAANQKDPYEPIAGRVEGYDRFFLEAIDHALALFPDDRLQTAREWLVLIDNDRRREAARSRAERDHQLQQVIRDLVETTNAHVSTAPPAEKAEKKAVRTRPLSKPVSKPKAPMFPDLMGPPPPIKKKRRKRKLTSDAPNGQAPGQLGDPAARSGAEGTGENAGQTTPKDAMPGPGGKKDGRVRATSVPPGVASQAKAEEPGQQGGKHRMRTMDADGTGAARPQIAPASQGDEQFLKGETRRKGLLDKVLNVSLWRVEQANDKPGKIAGKVDR